MTSTSTRRRGAVTAVDPFLLVAGGLGLVALVLLGVGLYALLSSFGVTPTPGGWTVNAGASAALLAVAVAISVYGKRRNGRRRPEVRYGR